MICAPWVIEADVAACNCDTTAIDPARLDDLMMSASEICYLLSGSQFSGICVDTIRPPDHRQDRYTDRYSAVFGGNYNVGYGWGSYYETPWCGPQGLLLPFDHPISATVRIDGATVTDYRLDGRILWREAGWPTTQRMGLPDTEPGTWAVTVTHGQTPPVSGVAAAAALTAEMVRACVGDKSCRLPLGAVSVVRQGVSIDVAEFAAMIRAGAVGVAEVDMFLAAANPAGLRRRGRMLNPDLAHWTR